MIELTLPKDRMERLSYLRVHFPEMAGADGVIPGGRQAALEVLANIDPVLYARTRNHLSGRVTGLSPYIRHGCITLLEVLQAIKAKWSDREAYKLIFELAWRDFWRRLWREKGQAIHRDLEAPKVPIVRGPLPEDILQGQTGLPCMDHFIETLKTTGYLHNHARMWFAAYCVHFRGVDWKVAADWFLGELIDGDLASNHLSWQWVASTFSHKPYFFNRENLERYTDSAFCASCRAQCPFDASYEALEQRLFGGPS